MIIFFRTKKLAQQLKSNSVPEFHKFLYLTIPLLSEALGLFLPKNSRHIDFTYFDLILLLLGMTAVWCTNQSGDNKSFLDRFVCLSFPVYLKINILAFFYTLFSPFLWDRLRLELEVQSTCDDMFFIFNGTLYFVLISYWIYKVSRNKLS